MIKLAWEGFLRYRKRRKNLSFVLVISFMLLLFFMALFGQMNKNIRSFWVDRIVGGNVIVDNTVDFYDFYTPVSLTKVFDFNTFIQRYSASGKVFAPRLRVGGLLEQKQELPMVLIGVDPVAEQALGKHISVENGRWCSMGQREILLAESTALTIGVEIGDKIIVTVMTQDGYPSYELLTLTGHISFGNVGTIFGVNTAYMPIDVLRELTGLKPGMANEVVTNAPMSFRYRLDKAWRMIPGPNVLSLSRLINIAMQAMSILLFLLFGVYLIQTVSHNIILMLEERNKEISVYLTFGAKPSWIRKIMLLELFFYALYCAFLGSIFGSLLVWGFNSLGLYSIDIATEVLMSSSHFVVGLNPLLYTSGFFILCSLMGIGATMSIWKSTGQISLRDLTDLR